MDTRCSPGSRFRRSADWDRRLNSDWTTKCSKSWSPKADLCSLNRSRMRSFEQPPVYTCFWIFTTMTRSPGWSGFGSCAFSSTCSRAPCTWCRPAFGCSATTSSCGSRKCIWTRTSAWLSRFNRCSSTSLKSTTIFVRDCTSAIASGADTFCWPTSSCHRSGYTACTKRCTPIRWAWWSWCEWSHRIR